MLPKKHETLQQLPKNWCGSNTNSNEFLHHRAMTVIAIAPATLMPITFLSAPPFCFPKVLDMGDLRGQTAPAS